MTDFLTAMGLLLSILCFLAPRLHSHILCLFSETRRVKQSHKQIKKGGDTVSLTSLQSWGLASLAQSNGSVVLWSNEDAGEHLQLAGAAGLGKRRQKSRYFSCSAFPCLAARGK